MLETSPQPLNYFNYYTEIEEVFVRRRGKHLLLSPIDWAMIEGWQERGIPLHIVIRGIESVFDGFDKNPGPRTIKGLLYCREEIEAQFAEWQSMQAGKSAGENSAEHAFDTESIRLHIDRAIANLSASPNAKLRDDFGRAATRLAELKTNLTQDFEIVDKSLCDIENFLDHALLTKQDSEHLERIEREITAELRAYKSSMEKEIYDQTHKLMLLKRLREHEEIPRLGLFYL
ncbi:MAG: hypothetical protein LC734_05740 [Acidobacteria bacterium]|nr:hypothetical protein [Acidobacteriota bacterium]